jgi:hypothetical protein
MSPQTASTLDYVKDLSERRFWGFLTLKFEGGNVVHIRQEENMKPQDLPEKSRRGSYVHTNR